MQTSFKQKKYRIVLVVVVAALGYFVDIYDLVLFGVVKSESLKEILPQASPQEIADSGKFLFNMQMLGMLLGGLLWGILGDKKGRLKVLFGSILLYSLANILNAFTTDITTYAFIRVVAGIGLAGELGAGITLVSEMMSKEKRGYGTMIIVTFGALGAVVASLVGSKGQIISDLLLAAFGFHLQNWQIVYILGGFMGLILLMLRVGTIESGFYKAMKSKQVDQTGDLRIIFYNRKNLIKYLHCILIGVPIWYIIGLLIMNSTDNFGPWLGVKDVINGQAVMFAYIGLSVGDLLSGALSQLFKSRKLVVYLYLSFSTFTIILFLFGLRDVTIKMYYFFCFLLGMGAGYWAIFVTIAAEQFGTNIRSTAANTIPNFVRGSVNLITLFFSFLLSINLNDGVSALIIGCICIAAAFISVSRLQESFGKDLNYIEIT